MKLTACVHLPALMAMRGLIAAILIRLLYVERWGEVEVKLEL